MEQVILRDLKKEDYKYLENIVERTWDFGKYSPPKTATIMAKSYLRSCLIQRSFLKVASVDGKAAGIIIGVDHKKSKIYLKEMLMFVFYEFRLLFSKYGIFILKFSRKNNEINKELLKETNISYDGKLEFFVVDESYRGFGIGSKLYNSFLNFTKKRQINTFFLFTDEECNTLFYEYKGLCRRKTKTLIVPVDNSDKYKMQCYIYDNLN